MYVFRDARLRLSTDRSSSNLSLHRDLSGAWRPALLHFLSLVDDVDGAFINAHYLSKEK
jgi:hypothetical protein